MRFIKKNIWTLMAFAMVAFIAMTGCAFAQVDGGGGILTTVMKKLRNLFLSVRTIIFILGGFGLVVVAFLAIFGKINWKWFAGLAVGLAVLAAANAIVNYSTGDTMGVDDTINEAGVGSL